ncbi:hypothetical protein RRG08_018710 [Elysia crispata]|uniref:Uncharacterized protein n=1 Tax=Elysia crispata TaxID=231223 RepID=A0AAE1CYM6_9GAST|nr:hypothetical protein RRG08_018710 [Elysia crispata]
MSKFDYKNQQSNVYFEMSEKLSSRSAAGVGVRDLTFLTIKYAVMVLLFSHFFKADFSNEVPALLSLNLLSSREEERRTSETSIQREQFLAVKSIRALKE